MKHLLFVLLAFLPASMARADQIIAETSGLANPDFVEDFGAGLYPNFTPITTEFPPLVFSHTRYYTTGSSNNLQGGFLTNDFSGAPDTFTVRFPGPVTEVSFVYHQIGTFAASNFRVLLGGVVVDSFSNQSNQTQPNNYFGFTNLLFDELQVDFVADFNIDELAYSVAGGPSSYCSPAGANSVSAGGAVLSSTGGYGTASASFSLTQVPDQPGLLFAGPNEIALPFGCGQRCVGGTVVRGSVLVPSGNQLTGAVFDMSLPGTVNIQYWYRDPANSGSCGSTFNLSNALKP